MAGSKSLQNTKTTSGELMKAYSGAFDIRAEGGGRPCRRIIVTTATVITGLDGVNVTLTDFGAGYVWDIQATAIVSGTGFVVW